MATGSEPRPVISGFRNHVLGKPHGGMEKPTKDEIKSFAATTDDVFKWIVSNGGDADIVEKLRSNGFTSKLSLSNLDFVTKHLVRRSSNTSAASGWETEARGMCLQCRGTY